MTRNNIDNVKIIPWIWHLRGKSGPNFSMAFKSRMMESVCSFFFNWLDYRSYRNLVWLWIERHRYGSRYGGSQCCRLCCSSLSTKWWCRSLRPWNINCPRQQCGRFGKRKKTNAMNLPKMQLARIDSQNGVLIRAISLDDEVMSQHQTDHHTMIYSGDWSTF